MKEVEETRKLGLHWHHAPFETRPPDAPQRL
jgi:hypothetical protein